MKSKMFRNIKKNVIKQYINMINKSKELISLNKRYNKIKNKLNN